MRHAHVVNFFKMQHLRSGRPVSKEASCGPKPTFPQHLEAVRLREIPGPLRPPKSGRAGGGRSQAAEPIPHRGGRGSDLDPPPTKLRPCLNAGGRGPRQPEWSGDRRAARGWLGRGGSRASTALSVPRATLAPWSGEPGRAEMGAAGTRSPGPAAFPRRPTPPTAGLPGGAGPRGPVRGSRLLAGLAARPTPFRHAAHWAGRRATSPLIGGSCVCHRRWGCPAPGSAPASDSCTEEQLPRDPWS